ncbi:MAG: beta-exotoxin transport system permease protein [Patescibacteria group bacterium]|nr:beta-exotoxin transport system permease protein [Patescibacteria group bacterium]
MLKSIFQKTLYEKRWMLLAWWVGIFAMTLLTMSVFPFFKDSGFEEMFANAPKSLQGLLGDAASYKTVAGYVDQQIYSLRIPMMTIIMAVVLFVGVGVSDEDRGTQETLLSLPVTRSQVFWHKFAAASVLLAIACTAAFVAVLASFPLIDGSMSLVDLAAATFGCWLVSMVFGSLTYGIGAATGKRGLTIGAASGLAFGTYLISSLAPAVELLNSWQKLTPFYYYNVPSIAQQGLRLSNMTVLLGATVVFSLAGLFVFRKRDLVRD